MYQRAIAVNSESGSGRRVMANLRRLAYTAVAGVPALLFAPGCGGEPPKPPPGAPQTDPADLEAPTIDLGEETDATSPPADPSDSSSATPE